MKNEERDVYVLVYECSDKSGFRVCGTTSSRLVAQSWNRSNDDTKVFHTILDDSPTNWDRGINEWDDDGE